MKDIIFITMLILSLFYFANSTASLVVNLADGQKGYFNKYFLIVCGICNMILLMSMFVFYHSYKDLIKENQKKPNYEVINEQLFRKIE